MGRGQLTRRLTDAGRSSGSFAVRGLACLAFVLAAAGCASINNDPINKPLEALAQRTRPGASRESETHFDDTVIALSFSGGGMRAAAFSHGVLTRSPTPTIRTRGGPVSLIDRVDFVSGVSGGAVPAAYFGLKKRAALADFREKFLLRNAEESLSTDVNVTNLSRGFSRRHQRRRRNFRAGSTPTCSTARPSPTSARRSGPRVWINASDIYNRTPFLFGAARSIALCSDFTHYPVVARGRGFGRGAGVVYADGDPELSRQVPDTAAGMGRAAPATIPNSPPMLRHFADAIVRYRNGDDEIRQAARRRAGRQLRPRPASPSRGCRRSTAARAAVGREQAVQAAPRRCSWWSTPAAAVRRLGARRSPGRPAST